MKKLLLICVSLLIISAYAAENKDLGELKDLSADATLIKIFNEGPAEWNVDKEFLLKDGNRTGNFKHAFAFYCNSDSSGYIIVELKKESTIKKLEIENRQDLFKENAASLAVWVSKDQKEWEEVWAAEKAEGKWEIILNKDVNAKFVKIGLKKPNYLHLNKVRIYGK